MLRKMHEAAAAVHEVVVSLRSVAGRSIRVYAHCSSTCGRSVPCSRSILEAEAGETKIGKRMSQLLELPLAAAPCSVLSRRWPRSYKYENSV